MQVIVTDILKGESGDESKFAFAATCGGMQRDFMFNDRRSARVAKAKFVKTMKESGFTVING